MDPRTSILLDSRLCVGCGACAMACKEANKLPPPSGDILDEDLSDRAFTTVSRAGGRFVRRLCMHCEFPSCASVCPVGAFEKTAAGPVIYHDERCIGCRYCMLACPFGVPRYEWSRLTPLVRKCTLCAGRLAAGLLPACATVCPTGATRAGPRDAMVAEARKRIAGGGYLDRIYGLQEAGGTSILLISDVPFKALGYPENLPDASLPDLTWRVLEKIPGVALLGGVLLGGVWWITNRRMEIAEASIREEGRKTHGE